MDLGECRYYTKCDFSAGVNQHIHWHLVHSYCTHRGHFVLYQVVHLAGDMPEGLIYTHLWTAANGLVGHINAHQIATSHIWS